MLKIKNLQVLNLDPKLIEVCEDLEFLGFDTITSAFRPGDKGVHGTLKLRGIDFRCKDDEKGKCAEKYINHKWQYDPKRPDKKVCMYHDVGRGKHIHLQVHPNTVRKNKWML